MGDMNEYTRTVNLTTETPEVDEHLLRIWESRHTFTRRWKRQKLNQKLKKRIAELTAAGFEYAIQLAQFTWHKTCNELQDQLGTKDAWLFLRHLLDPSKSKWVTNQTLHKIARDFPGTIHDLLIQLELRQTREAVVSKQEGYKGASNPELESPFTF